jgi:hypothetical protein
MFEKTSKLAEQVASSVSRRGFLDSLGGWAATAALGVAGVLTTGGSARADRKSYQCCWISASCTEYYACVPSGQSCPASCCGIPLVPGIVVKKCTDCAIGYGNGCPPARACPC